MTAKRSVTVTVNGETRSGEAEPRMLLSDFLREELGLTGTHVGCEHGICGACTVHVDGEAGAVLPDVRGPGRRGRDRHRGGARGRRDAATAALQQLFSKHRALQCGFCTPGMLMTALDLVRHRPNLTEAEIRSGMAAVLCRCTGYEGIVHAVAEYASGGER